MSLKKQTFIPSHLIRRVDAPAFQKKEEVRTRPGYVPRSEGLKCPGCDSRDDVKISRDGKYPLVCTNCGVAGGLMEFKTHGRF